MLAFILIFLVISVIFYISMLFLSRDEFMQFFNSKKQKCIDIWSEYDSDERIIALAFLIGTPLLCVIYVVSDKDGGLQSVFEVMMQVIALTLAIVAAIIAYRNYRRKSGDGLSYAIGSNGSSVSIVVLYNEKDKQAFIFAIDIVLSNGTRVRLVDFFLSEEPFSLAAFQSRTIRLGKVLRYNEEEATGFNFKDVKEFICITPNGETSAKRLNLPVMTNKYIKKNNILRAYRVQKTPEKYGKRKVDLNAKYWIHIKRFINVHFEPKEFFKYVLCGYIENDHLILTAESLEFLKKRGGVLQKLCVDKFHNKKVHGKYSLNDTCDIDGSILIKGLIWQDPWDREVQEDEEYDIVTLSDIEEIIIDNKYKES